MNSHSKFEFATLDRKKVANSEGSRDKAAFKSLFASLKEDLLQSQELLRSREEAAANARESAIRAELEAQLPLHHKAGYEEGYTKGFAAAKSNDDQLQKQLLQTVEKIATNLESITHQLEQKLKAQLKETITLARYIAAKVIGATPDDRFFVSIEQMLLEQLPLLIETESLRIQIHSSLLPLLQLRLDDISRSVNFIGNIRIQGVSHLQPGDCLLEWDGGSLEKSRESLQKAIDTVCEQVAHGVSYNPELA